MMVQVTNLNRNFPCICIYILIYTLFTVMVCYI